MTQQEWPLVYTIVLNWNGAGDTIECIQSLQQSDYPRQHIIVVDNASTDDSAERIRSACPGVPVVEAGTNMGYAGGNNVGMHQALEGGADFVWILNNDTLVAPDALRELMNVALADPHVGIAASKIYYASMPGKLWFAGAGIHWRWGIPYHIGQNEEDRGQYDQERDLETATGCSMLASRPVLEKIGLFDERYFLYFEETDFCFRARQAGYRVVYAPKSRIWHKVSQSVGEYSKTYLYYYTRNHVRFLRTYRSTSEFLRIFPRMVRQSRQQVTPGKTSPRVALARYRLWVRALRDGLLGRGGRWEGLASR